MKHIHKCTEHPEPCSHKLRGRTKARRTVLCWHTCTWALHTCTWALHTTPLHHACTRTTRTTLYCAPLLSTLHYTEQPKNNNCKSPHTTLQSTLTHTMSGVQKCNTWLMLVHIHIVSLHCAALTHRTLRCTELTNRISTTRGRVKKYTKPKHHTLQRNKLLGTLYK